MRCRAPRAGALRSPPVRSARRTVLGGKSRVLTGDPGRQELHCVGGRRAVSRRVDVGPQTGLGRWFHRLEVEVELANRRMPQPLSSGPVVPHPRVRPGAAATAPNTSTARRRVRGVPCRGSASCLETKHRRRRRGRCRRSPTNTARVRPPVRGTRIGWSCRTARVGVEHRRVEGSSERAHREDVVLAVADPRRGVGDRVEHLLRRWPHADRGCPRPPRGAGRALPGEVEHVLPLGLVQLQPPDERVQHGLRGTGQPGLVRVMRRGGSGGTPGSRRAGPSMPWVRLGRSMSPGEALAVPGTRGLPRPRDIALTGVHEPNSPPHRDARRPRIRAARSPSARGYPSGELRPRYPRGPTRTGRPTTTPAPTI